MRLEQSGLPCSIKFTAAVSDQAPHPRSSVGDGIPEKHQHSILVIAFEEYASDTIAALGCKLSIDTVAATARAASPTARVSCAKTGCAVHFLAMKISTVTRSRLADLSVTPDALLAEAVARMGVDPSQAAFVVNSDDVLVGMVTLSDFRRHMLMGGAMTDPVSACMNTRPVCVGPDAGRSEMMNYFFSGIGALPRVDEGGRLIEVLRPEYAPSVYDTHYKILWDRANQQSADYIEPYLDEALLFRERVELWDFAMSKATVDGLWAEFGVFTGNSINYFAAARPDRTVYGFDSFEGLKEDFVGVNMPAGTFDQGGRMPKVRRNVTLVKGWFDQTLPTFLKAHPGPVAFLHLDADTRQSTTALLDLIGERIGAGAVVVFDEYLGFPNWRNGEFRAWKEFAERRKLTYHYLGFSTMQAALLVH
jgi:CBS domain-containing protein